MNIPYDRSPIVDLLPIQQQANDLHNLVAEHMRKSSIILGKKVNRLIFPRSVKPPKRMRRKIGRMIRHGLILKRRYVLYAN